MFEINFLLGDCFSIDLATLLVLLISHNYVMNCAESLNV